MTFSLPKPEEFHVWWIDLCAPIVGGDGWLDQDEIAQAGRLATPDLHRRFVTRRVARRLVLSAYLGVSPDQVAIKTGPRGKPEVANGTFAFSASHSKDIALVAVSCSGIGVDVEHMAPLPDLNAVAATVCSLPELSLIETAADPLYEFYRIWVQKEAQIKLSGLGLGADLQLVKTGEAAGQNVRIIDAPAGHVAAVAGASLLHMVVREIADLHP